MLIAARSSHRTIGARFDEIKFLNVVTGMLVVANSLRWFRQASTRR
jgi:hypothetical protein